jgi:hypothetical protein
MLRFFFAVFLMIHGLVHMIGFMRALQVWSYDSWPYRTSVLFGKVELGKPGTRILGFFWLLPLVGFLAAGIAMLFNASWWMIPTWIATGSSLILCLLEWPALWPGVLINLVILGFLTFSDRLSGFLPT